MQAACSGEICESEKQNENGSVRLMQTRVCNPATGAGASLIREGPALAPGEEGAEKPDKSEAKADSGECTELMSAVRPSSLSYCFRFSKFKTEIFDENAIGQHDGQRYLLRSS